MFMQIRVFMYGGPFDGEHCGCLAPMEFVGNSYLATYFCALSDTQPIGTKVTLISRDFTRTVTNDDGTVRMYGMRPQIYEIIDRHELNPEDVVVWAQWRGPTSDVMHGPVPGPCNYD